MFNLFTAAQACWCSELSRRQGRSQCITDPAIPTYVKTWFHLPEIVSHAGPEIIFPTEQIDKTFQVSNLEPTRHLQVSYSSQGVLNIKYNWIGTHPAWLSSTYLYIRFTDFDGNGDKGTKVFYIPEIYPMNSHECNFQVDNDTTHRRMHVQVVARPLGHHDDM